MCSQRLKLFPALLLFLLDEQLLLLCPPKHQFSFLSILQMQTPDWTWCQKGDWSSVIADVSLEGPLARCWQALSHSSVEEVGSLGTSRHQHDVFQKDWHAKAQLFFGNPYLLSLAGPVITGLALTLTLAAWGNAIASLCTNVKEIPTEAWGTHKATNSLWC